MRTTLMISGIVLIALVAAAMGQETAWVRASETSPVSSRAESPELKAALALIQDHYDRTRSFSATFKEVIVSVGGRTRLKAGKVYFSKPGKMRWEFVTPFAQTIVSDGKFLYNYEPELNQVVETPLRRAFRSAGAVAFLLGMGSIDRDFSASLLESAGVSDGLLHLKLRPKKGGRVIEVGVVRGKGELRLLRLTDQLGNVTSIAFADVKTNPALADSLFTFALPEGADVVMMGDAAP